ncbi:MULTISPECIES: AAA family ATPase [Streptomycetaceae]|uniref:AAA family ATPase n=1 Tax=Streptomycetaceae TaxID=2062 RepID=UPI000B14FE47|nr:hypothetical protein [Streptomyces sp. CB02056]
MLLNFRVANHRSIRDEQSLQLNPVYDADNFRLEEAARGEPSWYVVDLLIDGIRYTYGFSVDDDRVVDEWLHSFPHGRKRKIFERSVDGLEIGDPQHRRELELVENITEPDVLFMSLAARSRQDGFRPVYDWFARSLQFSRRMQGPGRIGTARILENPDQHPEFVALLRAADLGIAECGTERVLLDEEELRYAHSVVAAGGTRKARTA